MLIKYINYQDAKSVFHRKRNAQQSKWTSPSD